MPQKWPGWQVEPPHLINRNTEQCWRRFTAIEDGGAWHWDEVHSSDDNNQVVEFTLSAGTHTLEIAHREDGTLLDAIVVIQ